MKIVLPAVLFLLLHVSEQGSAMQVKLLTLDQMIANATVIFVGQCLTSRSQEDLHFGRTVTVAEFEVVEALKGRLGETHTVKQYGGTVESKSHRIAGMPTYTPGEDVILFLYGESQYGFTSPVGILQGKFTFVTGEELSSSLMIVNGINNRGLLAGLDPHVLTNDEDIDESQRKAIQKLLRVKRGPISYEDFRLVTKALIGSNEQVKE
ncbi:MAG: hypothetical protein CMH81_05200 [Nitrospiraceae bacterium]|nr:hypothetical protein [Nitrospiraceae bacterium]|tara:strand:- start:5157 stop:5780 length:624 start_codon:yes stop_codon:yes gene_type:complete